LKKNKKLIKPKEEVIDAQVEENIVDTKEPEKPKFKNSEFISPIFGKAKDNDEFLKELKDFRSNL
jgi:hypothetical protein